MAPAFYLSHKWCRNTLAVHTHTRKRRNLRVHSSVRRKSPQSLEYSMERGRKLENVTAVLPSFPKTFTAKS